jgi:hypothetical protein
VAFGSTDPAATRPTTGFNIGAIYDFDEHNHLLASIGAGLQNVSTTNVFFMVLRLSDHGAIVRLQDRGSTTVLEVPGSLCAHTTQTRPSGPGLKLATTPLPTRSRRVRDFRSVPIVRGTGPFPSPLLPFDFSGGPF